MTVDVDAANRAVDVDAAEVPSPAQLSFVRQVAKTVTQSPRQNLLPSAISLSVGVALVVAYYAASAATGPAFAAVEALQAEWGMGFSIVSTCFAAGLVPLLLQAASGRLPASGSLFYVVANLIFWAFIGIVAFHLYLVAALLFGDGTDAGTVAAKVVFDQFIFNPFFCYPFILVPFFRWRDSGFSCGKMRASLSNRRGLALQYCTMMVTNWCTWVPGCCVVYSFPPDLQIPCFSVIVFFFSTFIGLVSQASASEETQAGSESSKSSLGLSEVSYAQGVSEDIHSKARTLGQSDQDPNKTIPKVEAEYFDL